MYFSNRTSIHDNLARPAGRAEMTSDGQPTKPGTSQVVRVRGGRFSREIRCVRPTSTPHRTAPMPARPLVPPPTAHPPSVVTPHSSSILPSPFFCQFWGFANDIVSVSEAKRFYPLFGLGANVALVFSGQYVRYGGGGREWQFGVLMIGTWLSEHQFHASGKFDYGMAWSGAWSVEDGVRHQ